MGAVRTSISDTLSVCPAFSLQRVKLEGFEPVIRELETELDYLRRAQRYLEG